MGRFDGRAAVVTGSSRGIGRATAEALLREGAGVVVNSRKAPDLERTVSELEPVGNVVGVTANVHRPGSAEQLVDAAVRAFGSIDYVVNTVGITAHYGPTLAIDREAFTHTMVSNTWTSVELVQAAVAAGLERDGGAVVNVSSIGGQQVQPMLGAYAASKAALDLLTRTLARELGPRGVRVNGVAPGLIQTDMASLFWEGARGEAEAALLPLQRLGEAEDIARAITFLLSDASSWITGTTLVVDGGRMLIGDEQPSELFGVYDAPPSGASA